jgi:uncharacterized membrane protein
LRNIYSKKRKAKKAKLARKFGAVPQTKRRLPEISPNWLFIVLLAVVVFLISGGIYDLISEAPVLIQLGETVYFYVPRDMNSQTIAESMFFSILLVLGILGGYLASRTLHSSTRKESSFIAVLSIVLILISVFGSYLLLELKIPGIFM